MRKREGPNDSYQLQKTLLGMPPSPQRKSPPTDFGNAPYALEHPGGADLGPLHQRQRLQQQQAPEQQELLLPNYPGAGPPGNPRNALLPPLEEQQGKVFSYMRPNRRSAPASERKERAADIMSQFTPVLRAPQLEPLIMNWAAPAAGATMEERMGLMEQRLMAAERASIQASSAYNLQSEMVVALSHELQRATADLSALHMRFAVTANSGSSAQQQQQQQQLEQQLQALRADMSAQGAALMRNQHQLAEALRSNTDLRSQIHDLGDALSRATALSAAADAAIDRLTFQMQHGVQSLAADQQRNLGAAERRQAQDMLEQRRLAEMQDLAFREDARRRQAHHLAEVASLNGEVEHFRAEARAAAAALQSAVEQTNARLMAKEAELDHMQRDSLYQADREAMALSSVRVQVADLQNELADVTQQLRLEQSKRQNEAQEHEANLKRMEAQLLEAQDGIVKRTVALMESEAQAFRKAVQDLSLQSAERNNEARTNTEMAFGAIVRANNHREEVGEQRVGAMESALMDIAGATAAALRQLQTKLDTGAAQVGALVRTVHATSEGREAELRVQVNAALAQIKRYAQDMEDSLEHERLQLEEVLKLEIKGRMSSIEKMRGQLANSHTALDGKLQGYVARLETVEGDHKKHAAQISQGVEASGSLRTDLDELAAAVIAIKEDMGKTKEAYEAQLTWLVNSVSELSSHLKAEGDARQQADNQLQQLVQRSQADVQKDLEAHTHQALELQRQVSENHAQAVSRMDAMQAHAEASDKATAEARAAAAAELDQRLSEARTAAAQQLEAATQQLVKTLAADKQELQETVEASKKELAEGLGEESRVREQGIVSSTTKLQEALQAAQKEAAAARDADKSEVLNLVAADRKVMQEVQAAVQQAHRNTEALKRDEKVVAEVPQLCQDVKDLKGALGVALLAVGIPTVETALQPTMVAQASAYHSKAAVNDLTLARVTERLAGLEARLQQQQDLDREDSKQQLSELQSKFQSLQALQQLQQQQAQQVSDLQHQVQEVQQRILGAQTGQPHAASNTESNAEAAPEEHMHAQARAESQACAAEIKQQLEDLGHKVLQLEAGGGEEGLMTELQRQVQQLKDHQQEVDMSVISKQLNRQVGALDERLQELEAQQQEGASQHRQVQGLESAQAALRGDLEVMYGALQELQLRQPPEGQDVASRLAGLQEQLQETQAGMVAALMALGIDPEDVHTKNPDELAEGVALGREERDECLSELVSRVDKLESTRKTGNPDHVPEELAANVNKDEGGSKNDTSHTKMLQASIQQAVARLDNLEHWRDKLNSTNALYSDVKELENHMLERLDGQAKASAQQQEAVQRLMDHASKGVEAWLESSSEAQSSFTLEEANTRFATIANLNASIEKVHANYLRLQQNEHAILQALKAMDLKLTTHAERVAKVLILTARSVDRLHNVLREMEHDSEELEDGALDHPVVHKGTGIKDAEGVANESSAPDRTTLRSMNPLLKSSDLQALLNQGKESSVDEALRAIAREEDMRNTEARQRESPSVSSPKLPTVPETEDELGSSPGRPENEQPR
ncbi:hypothetical protein DUNSADRAFT_9412 [Dunaliella salina]|uniref:Uncharacterized protein n=1 Tax=Dunaliella salina TaxID=3046 RepID=A0ABQ7GHK6_DUNSA|nr:hypothetical protein DUNSADRAFT_9412 [Dunaliella salina]|eukprot:KAF5834062.1 hypothetical protein DUNSADRAFT_9412 [Dunaliella salina]